MENGIEIENSKSEDKIDSIKTSISVSTDANEVIVKENERKEVDFSR